MDAPLSLALSLGVLKLRERVLNNWISKLLNGFGFSNGLYGYGSFDIIFPTSDPMPYAI